jgi:Uma2 family endonuclease
VTASPPDGDHEKFITRIVKQVIRRSRTDIDFSGNKGLMLKGAPGRPWNHVMPDCTLALTELDLFAGADSWMPCEGVAMVLEVTSRRAKVDREVKRRGYARGGVPLYLLVDRDTSTVTLFSEPEGGDYRQQNLAPFGKPLTLPEPFGFDLETADFL